MATEKQCIGQYLRRFRETFNLKQYKVADAIGVTPQQYVKYEKDQMSPSVAVVINLANAFDVSADYLLGLSDTPRPVPADKTLAMEINNCRDALQKILSIADKVSSQGATAQ